MWYELELFALIAALVFSATGFLIACAWLWDQAKYLAAAPRRIYRSLAMLTSEPRFFANSLAVSRTASRKFVILRPSR